MLCLFYIEQFTDFVIFQYMHVAKWVERKIRNSGTSGWVKSKNETFSLVASLVSVHYLRPRTGLVVQVSILNDWVGYHVYLQYASP